MKWMLAALVVLACMAPAVGVQACYTHAQAVINQVTDFFGGTAVTTNPGHLYNYYILVTAADGAQTTVYFGYGPSAITDFLQEHASPPPVDVEVTEDFERNA